MKKAFTLAEVMITLTVVGVITAVIVPVAMSTKPNEDVMKFKKGHNTLYQVISTLIKSDDYYKDGDLGVRADGTVMSGKNDTEIKYFCNTFADLVTTKKVNCSNKGHRFDSGNTYAWQDDSADGTRIDIGCDWVTNTLAQQKTNIDKICADSKVLEVGEEIVTSDGIVYYQSSPKQTFGIYFLLYYQNGAQRNKSTTTNNIQDAGKIMRHFGGIADYVNKFSCAYKIICMDIDGMKKGEAPFGYAVSADGKIITGARADEWLEKSNQTEN